jgi:hypothetical protein
LSNAVLPLTSTSISLKALPTNRPHGSTWSKPPHDKPRPKPKTISVTLGPTSTNSSLDPFQQVRHLLRPSPSGFQHLDSAMVSVSCLCRSLHFAFCRSVIALFYELLSSRPERPHCDSACNATGVGQLFLGDGAGEARQRTTHLFYSCRGAGLFSAFFTVKTIELSSLFSLTGGCRSAIQKDAGMRHSSPKTQTTRNKSATLICMLLCGGESVA